MTAGSDRPGPDTDAHRAERNVEPAVLIEVVDSVRRRNANHGSEALEGIWSSSALEIGVSTHRPGHLLMSRSPSASTPVQDHGGRSS
jgi:hypothetical protein